MLRIKVVSRVHLQLSDVIILSMTSTSRPKNLRLRQIARLPRRGILWPASVRTTLVAAEDSGLFLCLQRLRSSGSQSAMVGQNVLLCPRRTPPILTKPFLTDVIATEEPTTGPSIVWFQCTHISRLHTRGTALLIIAHRVSLSVI